jgi:hypothetical protein
MKIELHTHVTLSIQGVAELCAGDARPQLDSEPQKVQRESDNLYFHTSVTFELSMVHRKSHRQSIGDPVPVPNPKSFQVHLKTLLIVNHIDSDLWGETVKKVLHDASITLRSPRHAHALIRVRAAVLRRGALLRQNRQPRLRCAPHVCPGRQHSGSAPIQTLGHAPIAPELEIAIFAPAAQS